MWTKCSFSSAIKQCLKDLPLKIQLKYSTYINKYSCKYSEVVQK